MSTKKTTKKKASKKKTTKKKSAEHTEAKRQATVHVPASKMTLEDDTAATIDHGTIMDNHVADDTNKYPAEDLAKLKTADLSFWGGSWTWAKSQNSYGDKPEDSWFINPTPKLIGEVMTNAPLIHEACRVALQVGEHKEQLGMETERYLDFLRVAEEAELISECLDMLTAYQGRFFESVQRYLGLCASYENQLNRDSATEEDIESAKLRKIDAGAQCRGWTARLLALTHAYHEVVNDSRAYNLKYDFSPDENSSQFGLFRWSVTNALNKIGRRLARSIKTGSMDADKYRIPRPWLEEAQLNQQKSADEMISDFN